MVPVPFCVTHPLTPAQHQRWEIEFAAEKLEAAPVRFSMVRTMGHFRLVPGDQQAGMHATHQTRHVRGPAVRHDDIHLVVIADHVDPRPIQLTALVAGVKDRRPLPRSEQVHVVRDLSALMSRIGNVLDSLGLRGR